MLARIAEVAGRRIIADPPVEGRLTLRLVDVPWDEALEMVVKIAGVRAVDQGDVIRVIGRPSSGARRAPPAPQPGDGAFELPR
ncbi:MAG: hypothetical protein QNJ91_16250 [Gammaproteobacteria bacterium]|nr:hypothetical protein [Gammaproteobacteria bacterium]